MLDVGAFRARCERHVVQVGDLHPFAAARVYGPVVVGGREAHDGGVGSQGVQSDRSGNDAESRLGGSGRSGRVVEDVLPRDVDSRSAVGPEVVHVVVGIDSDHDVIAVVVGSHVALRDAVAEYGGLVALPEEAAFVFVVVTVGDDAAVVLASHELVVVVVHEAHDAAAAPFVLADHVAAVHDLGEFGACARDAGDVADAGAACGGELVAIVAVVGAVGQVGVAVGRRDDARCAADFGGEVAAVDAGGERDGVGRAGVVGAESADAADLYAGCIALAVAAVFGRKVGFVGQTVEHDPFVGERESDHAHRHADVARRAVERHRGFVGDVAHGGVVDQSGEDAAVGGFRGRDFQRTGGVEDEVFDDGSGTQCAEESPGAVGVCVAAHHSEIADRVILPVEEAREGASRADREGVAGQCEGRVADRSPCCDARHVYVVEQYDDTLLVLPRGEGFARVDRCGELHEVVGRPDAARRCEGVERFRQMAGREHAVLFVIGADARFVDVFRVGLVIGGRQREFQSGRGGEASDGEFDGLGLGQIGSFGKIQRQLRAGPVGCRGKGERRRIDRAGEGQPAFETLFRGGLYGDRPGRTVQLSGVDAQFDDREDVAERDVQRPVREVVFERRADQRRAGRVDLFRTLERDRAPGLHADRAFGGRGGVVGCQRLGRIVGGDARFAGEGGRGAGFGGGVFVGSAVVYDRDAVAGLPGALAFVDVGAGRCRAGGFDDQPRRGGKRGRVGDFGVPGAAGEQQRRA